MNSFGKALHFHWEHQLLLSFEWKDGKEKMGRNWMGENEGATQRSRGGGTFATAAYLAQGFDEAWQSEVLESKWKVPSGN